MSNSMDVQTRFPVVEEVLDEYSASLGPDRVAYTNHVLRVLNFFRSLSPGDDCPQQVLIAAAFHDLGIWTARTFDYLEPSIQLARDYLESVKCRQLESEVEAIILQHHKLTTYGGPFASTVETFRKADLIDVSLGAIRRGVSRQFVHSVRSLIPNAGFHHRLVMLTVRQFLRDPFHPLPMVRW